MRSRVTFHNLGPALAAKRGKRGLREVASEIGISPATLSRIERGKLPDLETFSKICQWLPLDPSETLGIKSIQQTVAGESFAMTAHLKADRNLGPGLSKALAALIVAARRMGGPNP